MKVVTIPVKTVSTVVAIIREILSESSDIDVEIVLEE